ncbi:MAG: hypothetical protein BGO55_31180 [Sphingobacteriales bacterium 50-39]|nr:MAG: hypothetical protein BGO55_31180 [Sphingobacteriales bacterium 50-39]
MSYGGGELIFLYFELSISYAVIMKTLTFFLLLSWLYPVANAQTAADTAATRIRQLLKPGKHLVHYFRADPNKQLTAEQKALLAKVRKALSENTAWVLDPDSAKHISGTREGVLNDVRKKLNLTEEEWKALQDLTDVAKKDIDIYGNDTLEIIARGDILYFRGTGKASGLDSVCFDLARNIALFRQRNIPFMNIFHIPATANAFRTPGVTYAYELNNNTMTDSTDINTLHLERYDFGVSYQPLTGRTMVIFMTATGNMHGVNPVLQPNIVTFLIE